MAAYAALVPLINDLELIPNHPTHSFSFENKQITSLTQTVNFLIDFMETYDFHGSTTEAAKLLESRIASAAHTAHHVVQYHVVDQIHGGKARCNYFLLDLQKAIEHMEFIKRKAMQFKAKSGLKAEQLITYRAPEEALSSEKNVMVGFDAAVLRLMEILTGETSTQQPIPIVGMGGMGKTILARNVYDHLHIQHHFDVRLWSTISNYYEVESILKELLFGERNSTAGGNVAELGVQLHKKLWGRRYLIVLDDMWSVGAWDEIQMFLPDNGNRSRVIVTTRLSNLAAHLSPSPFEMSFLDEDKSWELFCGKAFGEEECPVELEEIGKKIVKKCRGLPLSIVVIGGHFRKSCRVVEYWENVASYMNPISSIGADDQCLKILSLSYEHLPARLKPCFLYMGIFKEDEWVETSKLLRFWVAEGFLRAKKDVSFEEVGEAHLNDLVDRNLIIAHKRGWNGQLKFCGVHDIVRELCLKVGKIDKFVCVVEDATQAIDIQKERRVVIREGKELKPHIVGAVESTPLLRSLISHQNGWFNFDQLSIELRLLKILVFGVDSMHFPHNLFLQVNLRHLDLSVGYSLTYLIPSSISLFWNLQSLAITNFGVGIRVPYEIWEMTQLRHLHFLGALLLPDPAPPDQQECIVLKNLHTLIGAANLRLTEEVCKRMPNLKELNISYFDFPDYDESVSTCYYLHNLGLFNKLESLCIIFGYVSEWGEAARELRFPSSVENVGLSNCHFDWEDLNMMIKDLPHLSSLSFDTVHGVEWNVLDGQFPSLKELHINECDDLVYWNANSSQFPVLEKLHFYRASKLSEIPFDIGEIPTLRNIDLADCSVSSAVSAMRILVEQESLGNEELQLYVSFRETEEEEIFQQMVQEEGLTTNNLHI